LLDLKKMVCIILNHYRNDSIRSVHAIHVICFLLSLSWLGTPFLVRRTEKVFFKKNFWGSSQADRHNYPPLEYGSPLNRIHSLEPQTYNVEISRELPNVQWSINEDSVVIHLYQVCRDQSCKIRSPYTCMMMRMTSLRWTVMDWLLGVIVTIRLLVWTFHPLQWHH